MSAAEGAADSAAAGAAAAAAAEPAGARVVSLSCGSMHSVALVDAPGGGMPGGAAMVVSFGRGEDGQLGHGDAQDRTSPTAVFALLGRGVSSVHCGAEYTVAVAAEPREVHACGWGDFGRLGTGDCADAFVPASVPALAGRAVAAVACGDTHTLVATAEGELWAFGRNANGQLGVGTVADSLVPLCVEALAGERVVSVAAGAEHSVCSTAAGTVYAFGWGRYGCVGDGETLDRASPTRVAALAGVTVEKVAAGWRHSLAVDAEGGLWSWGWSKYYQLGHGDQQDQLVPKKVEALAGRRVALVAGGWRHTLAADAEGQLWAWGWNLHGQAGTGSNEDVRAPARVRGALEGEAVALLAAGWRHSLCATRSGAVFAWGRGNAGQLGRGDAADANAPALVPALSAGTVSVAALAKAAHPVVNAASIQAADRYAVVPDFDAPDGEQATVPEPDGKRQRT